MLRISSFTEPPMQVSKWLTLPVLMDPLELLSLFNSLDSFLIYETSQVISKEKDTLSHGHFFSVYEYYIASLKNGELPDEKIYRSCFSSVFSTTAEALYKIELPNDRQLIRICKPVLQLQPHSMDYSPFDDKFRSIVHGPNSILWGIQFSYPQLYLHSETKQALKVVDDQFFTNTSLFRSLQRWVRENTIPTPFQVGDRIVNVPIRLGKNCLDWINKHPQLSLKKLKVLL